MVCRGMVSASDTKVLVSAVYTKTSARRELFHVTLPRSLNRMRLSAAARWSGRNAAASAGGMTVQRHTAVVSTLRSRFAMSEPPG